MYEPDSSSSSVVSSTSRSPQSQSQSQNPGVAPGGSGPGEQQVPGTGTQWTKPAAAMYGNGGGGSPTITTNNGHDHDDMAMGLPMVHDHYGNGQTTVNVPMDQSQEWNGNGSGNGNGMEASKKGNDDCDGSLGKTSSSSGTDSNGHGHCHHEVPTTTTNGSSAASSTNNNSSAASDQPEQSSNLSSTQNLSPTKSKPPKLCQVCGDKAKSFHFGGLSCDSCKAFFRRSVHNDAYKSFQCVYKHACEISISSRKSCQSCRFKKCLSIGMETNWVMTEEERNQLQKQRNEKKESGTTTAPGKGQQQAGTSSTSPPVSASGATPEDSETDLGFEPNVADMLKYMSAEERDEIEAIVNKYQHSYREIPFRVSNSSGTRKTVEIIQMFTTILRRFAYFSKLIPEFAELGHGDQSTLLRAGVLEMCLLRSALAFDTKNNRWPKTENMEFLKDCPQLRVEDMEKLVSKDLYHMHMQFINGIQELRVDEPTVMILLLIVLFYPERGPLDQHELIAKVQEKYLLLLNKYVQWRFGPRAGKVFPKLLTRLADLRQLNDFHTEYNLKMTRTEVEEIQEQLGNINLNPYPQWVLVDQQKNAAAAAVAADGNIHSAHAYADMSADQLSGGFTPSPDFQDIQMHAQQQQQQQQQQHPGMTTAMMGGFTGQMPYAANAGAPRQFPGAGGGPGAAPTGSMPQMPNMRQLFMQFVSQRIPTLINNPFATFPMENELSGAAAFFEQMSAAGGGGPSMQQIQSLMAGGGLANLAQGHGQEAAMGMGNTTADQHQQPYMGGTSATAPSVPHMQHQMAHVDPSDSPPQISQICNILESSDPDTLRQLKESLSPTMVAKLSSIFAGGAGGAAGGLLGGSAGAADFLSSGSFDLSKIPPELIQSFLGGGGGGGMSPTTSAAVAGMIPGSELGYASQTHAHAQQYAGQGYSGGGGGSYAPNPDSYHHHHHQEHQHHQHQHQQLDLSTTGAGGVGNWSGGGVQVMGMGTMPEQHHQHHQAHQHQQHLQQPILVGGGGDTGVDFTSAAFMTHRQQNPHAHTQHVHHFDQSPTAEATAAAAAHTRYGNGSTTTTPHW